MSLSIALPQAISVTLDVRFFDVLLMHVLMYATITLFPVAFRPRVFISRGKFSKRVC